MERGLSPPKPIHGLLSDTDLAKLDEPIDIIDRSPRRVTFNSEREYYPAPRRTLTSDSEYEYYPPSRRTSFASTRAGAVAPPSLNTRLTGQYESLQSPTIAFLDDSSINSDSEDTDVEYDSDTASSFDLKTDETKTPEALLVAGVSPANFTGRSSPINSSQFINYGDKSTDVKIELKTSENKENLIFQWAHLEENLMDFENFTISTIEVLNLTIQEKKMVKERLQTVRKDYEKPFFAQYALHGRNMDPFVYQELWLQKSITHSHLNRKITIACFPFFLLEDHVKRVRLNSPTNHPPLTLLQSVVSSTEPERDMQQVVRRAISGQHPRCFYVGQLWLLILDDSYLVTCARLSEQELGGEIVALVKEPTRGMIDGPFIKVTDGGNCTWRLRLDDCTSWFQFTANFMEINSSLTDVVRRFEDIFKVTMDGRPVTFHNWARVVKKARTSSIHLVLGRRTRPEKLVSVFETMDDDELSVSGSEKVFPWQLDELPPVPDTSQSIYVDGMNIQDFTPSEPGSAKWHAASERRRAMTADVESNPSDLVSLEPKETNASSDGAIQDNSNLKFHALVHLGISKQNASHISVREQDLQPSPEENSLPALLASIDKKLLHNSAEHERKAYAICQPKTLPEATRYLLAITRLDDDHDDQGHMHYVQGLSKPDTFFMAAVQAFEFFLPLENDSAAAKKYWGACQFIMKNVLADPSLNASRVTSKSMKAFKRFAHLTSVIGNELSGPQGPDLSRMSVPAEFQKAWTHCIRYLMLFRFKSKYVKERERHLEKCEALLDRGRTKLWRAAAGVPLHKKEVATPLALMTAIITNLTKDVNRNGSVVDIAQMYSQYWKGLETQIKSGRSRTAQQDIVNLQQEISAVRNTLGQQLTALKQMYDKVEEQSSGWSELNSRHLEHAPRIEIPMLLDCIEHVDHRIKLFKSIEDESVELEKWMREQIALTKDRQENAIYAFTIVTVVFLPLSFVCSFLGMNTTGIRDMNSGQWVFWASALPLTFAVIVLALFLTDELGHVWRTIRQFVRPTDDYDGLSQHDRKSYWKLSGEARTSWTTRFKKNKFPKQQSAIAVNEPTPEIQVHEADPWGKPHRRTQTYRSMD